MADFKGLSVTSLAAANINVPRFAVELQVVNSQSGALLNDFTGANRLVWPDVITTLTPAQRRDLLELVMTQIITMKAGL